MLIRKRIRLSAALSLAALTVIQGTLPKAAFAGVATDTWAGGNNGTWNTSGNWTGGNSTPQAGDSLLFTGTTAGANSIDNDSGLSINNLTFNNGAESFTLSSSNGANPSTLSITGNVIDNAANTQTIGSGTTAIILAGAGGVQVNAGTLILDGANTYTGATTINSGAILQIGNNDNAAAQLGDATVSGSASAVTDNGTLLIDLQNSNPTWENTFTGTGSITLESATGSTIVLDGNDSNFQGTLNVGTVSVNDRLRFDNANDLPGASSTIVVQNGSGIYANTAFNYSGILDLNGAGDTATDNPPYGALRIGVANTNESGTVNLQSNALIGLQFSATISGKVTGSGQLEIAGANTLTLTNSADNWSGGTAIFNGTLQTAAAMSSNSLGNVVFGSNTGYVGASAPTSGILDLDGTNQTVSGLSVAAGSNNLIGNSSTTSNSILTFAGGTSSSTFSGVIEDKLGSGTKNTALTVASGTLVLSGANTYSGVTTINNSATLQIGNGGTTGAPGSASITDNGTLNFDRGDAALTVANGISGTGVMEQTGTGTTTINGIIGSTAISVQAQSGTLLLDAVNTYTGSTTIAYGATLQIGSDDNATAQIGDATVNGSASAVTDNGTLLIDLNGSPANPWLDAFTGTGAITLESATGSTIVLDGNNSNFQGTINVGTALVNDRLRFDNANNLPGSSSTIVVQNGSGIYANTAFNYAGTLDLNGVGDTATDSPSYGALRIGVANTNQSGTVNLQSNALIGLQFNATVSGKVTGIGQLEIAGANTLTLNNSADNWSGGTAIYNGTIQTAVNMSNNPLGNVIFGSTTGYVGALAPTSGMLDLDGTNQTVSGLSVAAGSNNLIGNSSTSAASTLTFAGGTNSSTFSGVIEDKLGSGIKTTALAVTSGTLTLIAANTYSGGTTVTAGALIGAHLGAFGSGKLTVNGGIVELDGFNETVASLQGSGGSISDAGTLTFGGSGTYTYSGAIGDGANPPLSLIDNNTGSEILNGLLSYTGTTAVNNGTLQIAGAHMETLSGNVSGGGNLTVGDGTTATSLTLSGRLSYGGTTTINNHSTLEIAGNQTESLGQFAADQGNLIVGDGTTSTNLTITKPAQDFINSTTVNTNSTLIGAANDAFGGNLLTVNGGTVELDGFSEGFGGVNGSGGLITNDSSSAATLSTGGGTSAYTYNGLITDGAGGGKLSLSLSSNQTFNGQVSYTGSTMINLTRTLQISGANTETLNGNISGGGSLTVGNGTAATMLTLGGQLSYGGTTTINNHSTAQISGNHNETLSGNVSGYGALIVGDGSTTTNLTLAGSGAASYGGMTVNTNSTLIGANTNALGGPMTINGGAVELGGFNDSVWSLGGSGGTLENGGSTAATLTFDLGGNQTFAGAVADGSGGGSFSVDNEVGNEYFSGPLSYTGSTTINGSTIQIAGNNTETLSGVLKGSAGYFNGLVVGDGVNSTNLTLGGTNSIYSGPIRVLANSALIGWATSALGPSAVIMDGGTLELDGYSEGIGYVEGSGSITNSSATPAQLNLTSGFFTTFNGTISDGSGGGSLSVAPDLGIITLNGLLSYSGATTISGAGLIIGGNNNETLSGVVSSNGGYLHIGDGTSTTNLTLNNPANNLIGPLTINTPGGTAAVAGSFGPTTLTSGTLEALGATPGAGRLTLYSLTSGGGNLLFNVGNAANADLITVTNAASFDNSTTITLNGVGIPNSHENIAILTANSLSNSMTAAANGTLAGGMAGGENIYVYQGGATLSGALAADAAYAAAANPNDLFLYVAGPMAAPSLYWDNDSNNGLWDINTSANWNDVTDSIDPTNYQEGDNVNFDDTHNSTMSYNVTLNTTVNPGSVTVNNSAGNYVISGTGTIGGTTSLTKEGSGALTLATANTYSGGTTIGNGTLIIGNNFAIPSGGYVTFGDGTNNGILDLNGIGATVGGLATASAGSGIILNNGAMPTVLTFNGGSTPSNFSGSIQDGGYGAYGTALVINSGTLTLSGGTNNTFSGGTTVNNGALIGGAAYSFGVGGLTVNGGVVELAGFNESVDYLQGSGGYICNNSSTPAMLTFYGNGGYYYFDGSIGDGVGGGQFTLIDNNTGTQTLGGPLSYTGLTYIIAGGTLVITGNNTETLSGLIFGPGNLTIGDALTDVTLTLTDANIYSGDTNINGGELILGPNASIADSPYIFISNEATFNVSEVNGGYVLGGANVQELFGNGTVQGNMTVAAKGTLSPGNPFGILTVDDNVTLDGTFSVLVDPLEEESPPNGELVTGDSGNVVLGGSLAVGAASSIIILAGPDGNDRASTNPAMGPPPFGNGDSYTLINAVGGIQNGPGVQAAFSSVSLPTLNAGLSWDTTMMNDNPANYQDKYTISVVNSVPTGFTLGAPFYSAALTGGQSYKGYYIQNLSGRKTDVQFLDGMVTTPTSLAVQFSAAPADATHLISDYVAVSGTNTDTYVLELSYTAAQLASFEPTSPVLAVDSGGVLKSAVLLNTGGAAHETLGAYNSNDFALGDYGVDTTNDVVWAVLNYSAGDKFGVSSRLVGDAAGTGIVTPQDISIVLSNQGDATNLWSLGDFNDTNSVTPQDISQVLAAQGNTAIGSSMGGGGLITSSPSDDKVPEPGSLALLAFGALSLSLRRRKTKTAPQECVL